MCNTVAYGSVFVTSCGKSTSQSYNKRIYVARSDCHGLILVRLMRYPRLSRPCPSAEGEFRPGPITAGGHAHEIQDCQGIQTRERGGP